MTRVACLVRPAAVLAMLTTISCAKPAPPPTVAPPPLTIAAPAETKVKASMVLTASADVNPDDSGRPSPVVVRVYQLKTDAAFAKSEFADLFDSDEKVLGAEMISRDEYLLGPSERRAIDIAVAPDTRFVGAVAAYRDIRNAQWRALAPPPAKTLTVDVQRKRVVLSSTSN
jgi:type VI secretion system protein VasD